MPFTVLVLAAAIAASYARGGRLRRIAEAPLEGTWLLFAGVALQVIVGAWPWSAATGGAAATLLLVASQGLVLTWVWRNRRWPGTGLIAIGLILNAAVIAVNGAMPVDPEAVARAGGGLVRVGPGKHMPMAEGTRLALLADRWPLPPLRTVISVGDAVLAAGLVPLVHALMAYRPPAERRGGRRGEVGATGV